MPDLWRDLLECLDLREVPADGPGVTGFEGGNQHVGYHRVFGGQLLAQFVQAAGRTCPGKAIKSLHVLFPRAGLVAEPVRYESQCPHQGASFATVTIVARQTPGVVATASVSMHAAEDGPDHQSSPDVASVPGAEYRVDIPLLPWETRATTDLDAASAGPPEFDLWMRLPPVSSGLAPAVVAYATDLTLIGTALRPLAGLSQRDAGTAFTSAVTSHTVWFHRPVRTDGWLLLRQHSPLLAHGRCFGRGDVLTEDGSLIASYAQEALVRFPATRPRQTSETQV